jgi:opacity protein-like surface antigen
MPDFSVAQWGAVIVLFLALAGLAFVTYAHRHHRSDIGYAWGQRERYYQDRWRNFHGGIVEQRVTGGRVDWIGEMDGTRYAVEFDFAHKWAEAIGQSLYYSAETGHRAGIVLIKKQPGDDRHVEKLDAVIRAKCLDIQYWVIP